MPQEISADIIDGGGGDDAYETAESIYHNDSNQGIPDEYGTNQEESYEVTYKPLEGINLAKLAKSQKSAEEVILRKLNYPYYGFLLYHSGNKRLAKFLAARLTYIDRISGANFGIFTLVPKHKYQMRIDERIAAGATNEKLKAAVKKWRKYTVPFTPDRSYDVAQALGLEKSDVPCLIIYRSQGRGYSSLALLKLKDTWFPKDIEDEKSVGKTEGWLTHLFQSLDESIKKRNREDVIAEFQKRMSALSRKQKYYRPIADGIITGVTSVVGLPFKLINILPSILGKYVEKKIGAE
jgi:hypothetical protein